MQGAGFTQEINNNNKIKTKDLLHKVLTLIQVLAYVSKGLVIRNHLVLAQCNFVLKTHIVSHSSNGNLR